MLHTYMLIHTDAMHTPCIPVSTSKWGHQGAFDNLCIIFSAYDRTAAELREGIPIRSVMFFLRHPYPREHINETILGKCFRSSSSLNKSNTLTSDS